jgi:hypothetical protein
VICGDRTVTFFAMNPQASKKLLANLKEFAPSLPGDVIQTYCDAE